MLVHDTRRACDLPTTTAGLGGVALKTRVIVDRLARRS